MSSWLFKWLRSWSWLLWLLEWKIVEIIFCLFYIYSHKDFVELVLVINVLFYSFLSIMPNLQSKQDKKKFLIHDLVKPNVSGQVSSTMAWLRDLTLYWRNPWALNLIIQKIYIYTTSHHSIIKRIRIKRKIKQIFRIIYIIIIVRCNAEGASFIRRWSRLNKSFLTIRNWL